MQQSSTRNTSEPEKSRPEQIQELSKNPVIPDNMVRILEEFAREGISVKDVMLYELEFLDRSNMGITYKRGCLTSIFRGVISERTIESVIEDFLLSGKLDICLNVLYYSGNTEEYEEKAYRTWVKNRNAIFEECPSHGLRLDSLLT